jgi:ABC-type thiamine transport system ATPase subunit
MGSASMRPMAQSSRWSGLQAVGSLLRMIAGLEDITGGTVSIGGWLVNEVEPKERDIAMAFQNCALSAHDGG